MQWRRSAARAAGAQHGGRAKDLGEAALSLPPPCLRFGPSLRCRDDLRHRAAAKASTECRRSHGLDHHDAERFRPVDRNRRARAELKTRFGALVDFPMNSTPGPCNIGSGLLAEIGHRRHGRSWLQSSEECPGSPGDPDGAVGPLPGEMRPRKVTLSRRGDQNSVHTDRTEFRGVRSPRGLAFGTGSAVH